MDKELAESIFSNFGVFQPLKYSPDQLKKIYIALIKKNHPDHGGSVEATKDLNSAYDMLVKIKTGLSAFGFNKN